MLELKDKLIVALDVDSLEKAEEIVNILGDKVKFYKIGSQLFTAYGPKAVEMVAKKGGQVFLDLKFHDIPNTVANAVRQAVRLKVKILTLHISGGEEMLKAAVFAAQDEAKRLKTKKPLLIGVTILTSQKTSPNTVLKLAKFGLSCGLDGVVCSPKETPLLKKNIRKKFFIITPGIRPKAAKPDDQKRTATVQEAIKAGSSFLVVGRPILEAKNPLKAVSELAD